MKILSFNWHTGYLFMLSGLDHQFEIAPPNIDSDMIANWDPAMRPIPPNVTPITREEMVERVDTPGWYGLILAHNIKDIVMAGGVATPKILVFHNKLSTEAALGKSENIIERYRGQVRELVKDVHCVFISQAKQDDWDLPGAVIMPGVDTALYGGYTGEVRRALRVGNSIRPRGLMTGYSLQEEVLKDLPNILLGENPDIPGCKVSEGWDGLKQAYRENRLFLNTTMPPWEDGYNLGMLEAMATGMPVVSVANPTSPITDGVDGFTAETPNALRERVVKLLDDPQLAQRVGAEGKNLVMQKFPMSAYLEKWERAIQEAVRPKPVKKARRAKTFKKMRAGKKNVVVCYTSYPATTGAYIERAFRKNHNVLTIGGKITPFVIDRWNLHGLKEEARTHDIHCGEFTVNIDQLIQNMPGDFDPDFFLWIESGLGGPPEGLDRLDIPTAAYLIDTHIHMDKHIETGSMFDVTFIAQRAYIPEFKKGGVDNVHWLPLACDPETHGKVDVAKEYDVGFAGSLTDQRRADLLLKLAQKVNVRYERLFMREMADFFCKSKIVFNNAIKNDLNMRVFEALCSGSLLLTDPADGQDDFFTDREHLVVYNDEDIADLARYYLENDDERQRIAKAGRKLVLEKHTYERRVEEMVKAMEGLDEFDD